MKILHRLFVSHIALAATLLADPAGTDHAVVAASRASAQVDHGSGTTALARYLDTVVPRAEMESSIDHLESQNEQRLQVAIDALIRQESELHGEATVLIREPQADEILGVAAPAIHAGKT